MNRWGLWIVLLLSVGVNAGILLTLALDSGSPEATAESPFESPSGELSLGMGDPGPGGGPSGPRGEGPFRMLEHLADRLELEGQPRERFLDLQRSFLRTGFEGRRQRWRLERELRHELLAAEPDRSRVQALVDELAVTFREMESNLAVTVLESRDLLNPQQERIYLGFLQRVRRHLDDEVRRRAGAARSPRGRRGPPAPDLGMGGGPPDEL